MKKYLVVLTLISAITFNSSGVAAQTTTKSRAGKDAAIGAGAGAITGAVVSKNHRAKGAVIGAAVGAAGGYALGKHNDKRKGRRIVKRS